MSNDEMKQQLEGAQFAAKQHLATVEAQAACIARLQDSLVNAKKALLAYEEAPGHGGEVPEPNQFSISATLREYADDPGYSHNDYADTMRQAADAIDALTATPAQPIYQVFEESSQKWDDVTKAQFDGAVKNGWESRILYTAGAATPAQPIAPPTETPQGFIDYVQANYHGTVEFHRPEWHANALWRAAMFQLKNPPIAPAAAVSAPTDEQEVPKVELFAEKLAREMREGTAVFVSPAPSVSAPTDEVSLLKPDCYYVRDPDGSREYNTIDEFSGGRSNGVELYTAAQVQAIINERAAALQPVAGLTDADVWRIRDTIKPGDGWDGDNWDLALAYAIERHLTGNAGGATPAQKG